MQEDNKKIDNLEEESDEEEGGGEGMVRKGRIWSEKRHTFAQNATLLL